MRFFIPRGYLIYFITAKTEDTYADLEKKIIELLVKNNLPYDKIFMQVSNKGKFCFENGIEYLIDDSFDNCSKANQYGIKSLLMTNEYNIDRVLCDNMYIINEFSEAKKYIKKNRRF